ncbi:MAG: hypothetical protein WDZ51_06985 [Pirellulaceae bacterium]
MNPTALRFLMSCSLVFVGCGLDDQGISGVQGTVLINGSAAPEGTIIGFSNIANESDAFMTPVDSDGKYQYRPPKEIVLPLGEYRIVVIPKRRQTEMGPNFIAKDVPIPGAPASYGKYSEVQTSDLKTEITSSQTVTFDIDIVSP